jgi:hypothetical protein
MKPPLIAHRFLSDGSIEVICRNCLGIVCKVQAEENAIPFLDKHVCKGAELFNQRLPQRPASNASPPPKGPVHFGIPMPAFLRRNKGAS